MPETATYYMSGLRLDILECADNWQLYAKGLKIAYRNAYRSQEAILKSVKLAIDERKKRDLEMMTFTLSLLTMGCRGC